MPSAIVAGIKVYGFTGMQQLLDAIADRPAMLIAVNAEKLVNADTELRALANRAIAYPDGAGAVLALRRKGIRAARIPGVELWLEIVREHAGRKRFYLVGSTTEVVNATAGRLRREHPGIEIVGFRNGFLEAGEADSLATEIGRTGPDVVFVAMGSPRQELLMARLLAVHPALYVGLGGSFDVYIGRKRRAPRLVQRLGIEWLYRLVREPGRWQRRSAYARFLWALARNEL